MGGKTTLGNGREINLANIRKPVSLRAVDLGKGDEIGRASCRERV